MTSRNSFSERALLRDGLRRGLWSIVLSGLGFLLSLLLPTLMVMQNALELRTEELREGAELAQQAWQGHLSAVASMLGGQNPIVKMVLIALAIVCGVSAFAYLHSRQKVDFYHSLPVSRTRLFFTNFATSALCVLPMYLLVLLITIACAFGMGFGEAVHWGQIGFAALVGVVFFLLLYALAALAAILCGNTIISLLLLLWILFAPVAVLGLQSSLFGIFYQHYLIPAGLGALMTNICPPAAFIGLDGWWSGYAAAGREQIVLLLVYLLAAVLVTALCWLLFRIRKSERAGTALAFEPAKTPVKLFMCLVVGTAVGLLFNIAAGGFWFWPGLIIGAALFHGLVEIIYAFDFHAIFAKPLHLAAVLVVLVAGALCLRFDVTGYDQWIPAQNKIAAVDIEGNVIDPALITPENIEAVRRLAEIGIGEPQVREDGHIVENYRYQEVAYRLTNGRVVSRAYELLENEEVTALLEQVSNSEEFKRAKWPLYTFDETDTSKGAPYIEIYNGSMQNGGAAHILADADQIAVLLDTLREETAARKAVSKPVIRLMLGYEQRPVTGVRMVSSVYENMAYITEADVRSLALLKQYTGVEPQALTAETVEKIELHSWFSASGVPVKVTDPADIALLLADAIDQEAMDLYNYGTTVSPSGVQLETWFDGSVYADLGDDWTAKLVYPAGKLPVETLKKYLPHEIGVPDGAVATVMAEPAA